jgi:hypothetical protein
MAALHAEHEVRHHLLDIRRQLGPPSGPPTANGR